jgi:hypothetical protein
MFFFNIIYLLRLSTSSNLIDDKSVVFKGAEYTELHTHKLKIINISNWMQLTKAKMFYFFVAILLQITGLLKKCYFLNYLILC